MRLASALLGTMTLASFALAAVSPINTNWRGVALHGYDAVSYFEKPAPEKGSDQFSYSYGGATWLFASAESRKKFAQ